MYAFYITGITDFQDMFTTLLASLKSEKKCWVCLFDCLHKKRQFYYYEKSEIIDFIKNVCQENGISQPEISFFGQKDRMTFENEYNKKKPELVFLQNTWHRHPLWYPTAHASKVIQYAWGADSVYRVKQAKYKVFLNVLRRQEDVAVYENCGISSRYFGDFKLESFSYKPVLQTISTPDDHTKICYISESFLRKNSNSNKIARFTDRLISFLHDNGFFVIWKQREKGYPKESWSSPLDHTVSKPDHIIDRDLNFPSSVIFTPSIADICIFIGWSSSFHIARSVNNNVIKLDPSRDFDSEIEKNRGYFNLHNTEDINLSCPKPSSLLLEYLEQTRHEII